MKIAIPTENKIVVSNDPRKSGFFKVVALKGEDIVSEEFRSNPLGRGPSGTPLTSREADLVLTTLSDCDVLIYGTEKNHFFNSRIPRHISTVKTNESIITSAVLDFNNRFLYNERNTCCSP